MMTEPNKSTPADETPSPWYRQPWMWLVVGLPLASVLASSVLITISVVHRDDLVRDDWYKAGRSINQDLRAEQQARTLGLAAQLELDPAALVVRVDIAAGDPGTVAAMPQQLQLLLIHSTMASEDITIILQRDAGNRWSGSLPRLPMGKRHLRLEPLPGEDGAPAWRLRADTVFQGVPVTLLPSN